MMNLSANTTLGSCIAALLALGGPAAVSAGAQTGTVPAPQVALQLHVVNPSPAQLDTLHALMRELDQLMPGSPARQILLRQIDGFLPSVTGNSIVTMRRNVTGARTGDFTGVPVLAGWIGLNVEGLAMQMIQGNRLIVTYFDHPSITSVDPDSPAQRVGIAPGDVLIAYNGNDVVGHQFDLTDLLVPDKKIAVTVQRAGDTKVFDVTVAKTPERIDIRRRDFGDAPGDVYFQRIISGEDDAPRAPVVSIPRGTVITQRVNGILVMPNGALGAIMSTVSPELAKTLKLETGVLVNDVSDGTPAARSGLRPGDVIVDVDGRAVASLHALQVQIFRRSEPSSVTLQVVRDKKTRKVTVSW